MTEPNIENSIISTGGCATRILRGIWHAFLDGAAIQGSCMQRYPCPEHLRSDAERHSPPSEQQSNKFRSGD